MKKLHVALQSRSYDIVIQKGILGQCADYIAEVCRPQRIMVVTDTTVGGLYATKVQEVLTAGGYNVKVVSFTPGEISKSLDSVQTLYREAFDFGMTRTDLAVALGGGVVGDLTGFFAATLFRGIPFIQLPTTILAQVDSSVGGKTGINVPEGKNLVGSFYQPKLVLIDPDTLHSLSDRDFSDGMAEVIKYGCICNRSLFDMLSAYADRRALEPNIAEVIYACCDAKRKLVEADELDTGSRMLLNFGHTMGHVIEKVFHFDTYSHGQAVAIGMVLAARLGEKRFVTAPGTTEKIKRILKQYDLPISVALPAGWEKTVLLDKKMQGSLLHYVFLRDIGVSFTEKMPVGDLVAGMKQLL